MPRKQSDKIITHRIEFSPKERELVDDIINTQKENQRLDAITSTLNAVGVAIGGSGALIAGLGLAAWFGFSVKDKIKDFVNNIDETISDKSIEIMTGKTKEELGREFLDIMGLSPAELKAEAQQLLAEKARYCNPDSQYYDEVKCAEIDVRMKELNTRYRDLVSRTKKLIADGNTEGSLKWGINKLSKHFTGLDLTQDGDGASWL